MARVIDEARRWFIWTSPPIGYLIAFQSFEPKGLPMSDILYAGGFSRPFRTDADEIQASKIPDGWHPATIDFEATATASGGGTKVTNFIDVLNFLNGKNDGSVEELIIIGHATIINNGAAFALGGKITPPQGKQPGGVTFTDYIDDGALSNNASRIGAVQKKFAKSARIVLVGCDAGLATSYLDRFATAFGVCVQGFSDKVWTGFTTAGNPPVIQSRGHVFVDSSGLMGMGSQFAPSVSTWTKDVRKLPPTSKSKNCP